VETPTSDVWFDAPHLSYSYLRLGQLYEEQGDPEKASQHLRSLVSLWAEADPEFEPSKVEATRTIDRLQGGG